LKETFGEQLQLEWRSFLLRPHRGEQRSLEKFRTYTHSWERVAADKPAPEFRVWSTDEGPPSHSIPPHLVAKAAAQLGEDAFETVHDALLKAYFYDNRDISTELTLRSVWNDAGLDEDEFSRSEQPEVLKAVIDEHNEAIENGAQGAPAFRMSHHDVAITGLHPIETLERWVRRILAEDHVD
jgi:predicted DsbA family dithiol-disulfide isomerase